MGRMNEQVFQEDSPPNLVISDDNESVNKFRSDSPIIETKTEIEIPDKETNVSVQTVPCSKCERNFAIERIQKHEEICTSIKPRKVYDIVKMRVKGTETEDLIKAGKFIHTSV